MGVKRWLRRRKIFLSNNQLAKRGKKGCFLFLFRKPFHVNFAVLTVILARSSITGELHLVLGFQNVDLGGFGTEVARFLDPFLEALTQALKNLGVLGVVGEVLHLPRVFPVEVELLGWAGRGEE